MSPQALNSALNRWDAVKARVWRAVGNDPMRGQTCPDWTYRRVCSALATIGATAWGADVAAADLELFVGRPLVVEAMDKAEVVIRLSEMMGVGKAYRKELREEMRRH